MKTVALLLFIFAGLFTVAVLGQIVVESSNFWECNLPSLPNGFWWKTHHWYVGAQLISPNGEDVAGVVGNESWLFACGNTSKVFKTPSEAIGSAVNCAVQYSTKK